MPGQRVQAVPGEGLRVPVWLLGSSLFSARLARGARAAVRVRLALRAGLPAWPRSTLYRREFQAVRRSSSGRTRWSAVNVVAADTDAEAARLFTSLQQQFVRLRRGTPGKLPPPIDPAQTRIGPATRG